MLQIFVKVLLIMVVLFAFIIPGFLLKKFNLLDNKASPHLSNILLYVCQPALVIDAFCVFSQEDWNIIQEVDKLTLLGNFGIVATVSAISMLLVFLLCKLIFIKTKDSNNKNIYTFVAIFSNCGFLGIPFVKMFTDNSPLAVMYIMVFNIVFIILSWTLGVALISGDIRAIRFKKIICNPSIICLVIALILFFVPQINFFMIEQVKELQIIPQYLSYMNAPISMIIVGIRLAEMSPKTLFCNKNIYLAGGVRLIISPLVTFGIALLFFLILKNTRGTLSVDDEYMILAPVIAMAMSPAASVVAMSERFGGNKVTATVTFATNTLLSIATIPLMITAIFAIWYAII